MKLVDPAGQENLGFGLGLRPDHYDAILSGRPRVDWFEVLSENYLVDGGKPLHFLDRICERYPVVMHGVSMSIGSSEPLDFEYLRSLRRLADRVRPLWISDHLCWTGIAGHNLHDLMPLPYTEEAIGHVAERVQQVQDFLGEQVLLENVSSYVSYVDSTLTEWDFLNAVVDAADCAILLDVNNIFVSARNHGFDPITYLDAIPAERVRQIHLAGHTQDDTLLIDTHDQPVPDPVWTLYGEALRRLGPVPTMIERDDNIPSLEELVKELDLARDWARRSLEAAA
jgi:uncharacterized protein (UPF0276 family)